MKIFGYNNFSTVRTPFNGTIDAIDRPSQEYRELPCQYIQEVDTGATANCLKMDCQGVHENRSGARARAAGQASGGAR